MPKVDGDTVLAALRSAKSAPVKKAKPVGMALQSMMKALQDGDVDAAEARFRVAMKLARDEETA